MVEIYATCDPGVHTAILLWKDKEIIDIQYFTIKKYTCLEDNLNNASNEFGDVLYNFKEIPDELYIEGVQYWNSLVSKTAAAKGDLSFLSYIVGIYYGIATDEYFRIKTKIINPNTWKGNMTDKQVKYRVKKVLNKEFKNIHIYCAAGIGLSIQGRL